MTKIVMKGVTPTRAMLVPASAHPVPPSTFPEAVKKKSEDVMVAQIDNPTTIMGLRPLPVKNWLVPPSFFHFCHPQKKMAIPKMMVK